MSTLKTTAEHGDLDDVKRHLAKGVDVNHETAAGHCALGGAIIHGHMDVVCYLLQVGANIKYESKCGWTLLYVAAWAGKAAIAAELLRWVAKLHSRTRLDWNSPDRWTPLHVAAAMGHIEVVRLLVKAGANVGLKDGDGRTPLELALDCGSRHVVQFLKREKAKSSVKVSKGAKIRRIWHVDRKKSRK